MQGGSVYLAPPDAHLSSANPLFASAAKATGKRTRGSVIAQDRGTAKAV